MGYYRRYKTNRYKRPKRTYPSRRTHRRRRLFQRPRYLGKTKVNGKFYDTNFKKPRRITKEDLEWIRKEYPGRNDAEKVDNFVNHMRDKYGIFDSNGRFMKMMGE